MGFAKIWSHLFNKAGSFAPFYGLSHANNEDEPKQEASPEHNEKRGSKHWLKDRGYQDSFADDDEMGGEPNKGKSDLL